MPSAFSWADAIVTYAEQWLSPTQIGQSLLCSGGGTDSDFTGGAAGWEAAALMLSAAGNRRGYDVKLGCCSACAPRPS